MFSGKVYKCVILHLPSFYRFRATQKVFDREASHVQATAADLEKVLNH